MKLMLSEKFILKRSFLNNFTEKELKKMNTSRRNFLKGAALTGAAAFAGGCVTNGGGLFSSVTGAPMHGYAAR